MRQPAAEIRPLSRVSPDGTELWFREAHYGRHLTAISHHLSFLVLGSPQGCMSTSTDNTTLFLAIQHPGEGGTYAEPASHWPDAEDPPRPALVVIQADDGGRVGE